MGTNDKKISICSTVYNNGKTIRTSLTSIIKQLPGFSKNFEIIVVDNYSTDGTWRVLKTFAKKYQNVKISQQKCTLGKGRALAYNRSMGNYIVFVDLDQIYEPIFSKILLRSIKMYKTGSILNGVMDRKTMDKIGNWGDFLGGEEWEFNARALSKGIKIYTFPVHIFRNQIVKANRQKRYAKNILSKFLRSYKHIDVRVRAVGFKNLRVVNGRSNVGTILAKVSFIKSMILKQKFYRYSNYRSNEEYVYAESHILSPSTMGLSKCYWVYVLTPRAIEYKIFNKTLSQLMQIGFNRAEFIGYRHLLLYTDKTDPKTIEFYRKFYMAFDKY